MVDSLGIERIAAIQRFVHSLAEERRFLRDTLSFEEIAVSSLELERVTRQRSVIFRAGSCLVVSSEPIEADSAAGRYLQRHPEGVGSVLIDVENVERALRIIESRGGTPIGGIERDASVATLAVATPLNDVSMVFVERGLNALPLPGFVAKKATLEVQNDCGFRRYDHLTLNFQTMTPAILWFERVLGFQPFWKIQFHTGGEKGERRSGSGLRSVVMWDERSNIKFALNEPAIPNFEASQIYRFCEDQRGSGIQHVAVELDDIVDGVGLLRTRGVRFMNTPNAYYRALPRRLDKMGLRSIPEDLSRLEELEILVDGEQDVGYLLQIFLDPIQPDDSKARRSPFFFELIQRKGDSRFGEGNFRALFESIETAQTPQLKTGTGG